MREQAPLSKRKVHRDHARQGAPFRRALSATPSAAYKPRLPDIGSFSQPSIKLGYLPTATKALQSFSHHTSARSHPVLWPVRTASNMSLSDELPVAPLAPNF